jgi:hypothetical protein
VCVYIYITYIHAYIHIESQAAATTRVKFRDEGLGSWPKPFRQLAATPLARTPLSIVCVVT